METGRKREMQNSRDSITPYSDEVRKKPRGETKRGLSKAGSHLVLHETGVFLPVGSGLSF